MDLGSYTVSGHVLLYSQVHVLSTINKKKGIQRSNIPKNVLPNAYLLNIIFLKKNGGILHAQKRNDLSFCLSVSGSPAK